MELWAIVCVVVAVGGGVGLWHSLSHWGLVVAKVSGLSPGGGSGRSVEPCFEVAYADVVRMCSVSSLELSRLFTLNYKIIILYYTNNVRIFY